MPDPSRIIDLANAFFDSCVLFTASDLGIFTELERSPDSDASSLASALHLSERGTRLLLDACVAEGLLVKSGNGYRNSPETSMFLVQGKPGDLSSALRYNRDVYNAWGKLPALVRTGEPVESPALHLGEDEARTRTFVLSMHGKAMGIARAVLPMLDLTGRHRLLDVGGGPGTFSALLTTRYPGLNATVLELPPIADIGKEIVGGLGATDHVRFLPGDYHSTPFPDGNDVVLMFGMLHQESEESIRDLLRRAWRALLPGGILYAMDMMTDGSRTAPKFSALFAINMALTKEHGWVFSSDELQQWMSDAGFRDFSVRPLPPPVPHWIASARK